MLYQIPALLAAAIVLGILSVWIYRVHTAKKTDAPDLDEQYRYRKEPHADQVTEDPNRIRDNEVTGG